MENRAIDRVVLLGGNARDRFTALLDTRGNRREIKRMGYKKISVIWYVSVLITSGRIYSITVSRSLLPSYGLSFEVHCVILPLDWLLLCFIWLLRSYRYGVNGISVVTTDACAAMQRQQQQQR